MEESEQRSFEDEIHERARILTFVSVIVPGLAHWMLKGFWSGLICFGIVVGGYNVHIALGIVLHGAVVVHTNYMLRKWRPREY